MAKGTTNRRGKPGARRLTPDEALIALFIGAMNANDHVAPDEAERAQHLIWSTRRFRRKSGGTVGRTIQHMQALARDSDPRTLIDRAARAIPVRLRSSAFAVVADLLLADGRLETPERRFLDRLGQELGLTYETARRIVDVVLIKNQL